MKHFLALILSLTLMMAILLPTTAGASIFDDLGGLLDSLGGLLDGEDDGDSSAASLDHAFEGETTQVKISGKTYTVHQNLIDALEKYDEFFDEYIQVMKNPTTSSYLQFLTKYTETMTELEKLEDMKMSKGDEAYYLKFMTDLNAKLLKAL